MMKTINQSFAVNFEYPVVFTEHLFSATNPVFTDFLNRLRNEVYTRKILFIIDEGVFNNHQYLSTLIPDFFEGIEGINAVPELIVVPGGEQVKNTNEYFDKVMAAINTYGIDRHSFLAVIGGGALLDMAGYAAAVAHRGVKLIRIPTTVLAQNDSGVGVKNSVNYYGKKNFLGTFAPPAAVFNDAAFLKTLSGRDLISGVSEAVKVALIKDYGFFEWLETNAANLATAEEATMHEQIFRCAELHLQHIRSGDPFELGSARPLDFGHWAAHKLEYLTNFEMRHGEAVAIGIALDVTYSHFCGMLTEIERDRVLNLLQGIGFKLYHPALSEGDKINLWKGLNEFREHLGGKLTITLLEKLGKGKEVHEMDFERIKQAVDYLEKTFAV
jgi:3-dehydroquinate synthase